MRNETLSNVMLGGGILLGVTMLGFGALDIASNSYPQAVEFAARYVHALPQLARNLSTAFSNFLIPAYFTDMALLTGGMMTRSRGDAQANPPEVI